MKIKDVAKLSPTDRFLYWIKERHSIYLKRQAGKPKPWTDDEVLQQYFFTNPYRENDKTTVWFRENVRNPLRSNPQVLMATVIFRWFNRISTGEELLRYKGEPFGSFVRWNSCAVAGRLSQIFESDRRVFTGAYMIKAGNGPKGCKIPNVCGAIDNLWGEQKRLVALCRKDCRLEALCKELKQFPFLGAFMSYEVVTDLRYTALLENASDVDTWCNPGPGALRGLLRLEGVDPGVNRRGKTCKVKVVNSVAKIGRLLAITRAKLSKMPRFEMREVEHSLCEFDKYERARTGSGTRMKRRYDGGIL